MSVFAGVICASRELENLKQKEKQKLQIVAEIKSKEIFIKLWKEVDSILGSINGALKAPPPVWPAMDQLNTIMVKLHERDEAVSAKLLKAQELYENLRKSLSVREIRELSPPSFPDGIPKQLNDELNAEWANALNVAKSILLDETSTLAKSISLIKESTELIQSKLGLVNGKVSNDLVKAAERTALFLNLDIKVIVKMLSKKILDFDFNHLAFSTDLLQDINQE